MSHKKVYSKAQSSANLIKTTKKIKSNNTKANNTNDSKFFFFPKGDPSKDRHPGVVERVPALYRV